MRFPRLSDLPSGAWRRLRACYRTATLRRLCNPRMFYRLTDRDADQTVLNDGRGWRPRADRQ
jgi:hypothetical protein